MSDSEGTADEEEAEDDDDDADVQEVDVEETDFAYGEVTPRISSKDKVHTKALLSPGPDKFKNALDDIINGFSDAICKSL